LQGIERAGDGERLVPAQLEGAAQHEVTRGGVQEVGVVFEADRSGLAVLFDVIEHHARGWAEERNGIGAFCQHAALELERDRPGREVAGEAQALQDEAVLLAVTRGVLLVGPSHQVLELGSPRVIGRREPGAATGWGGGRSLRAGGPAHHERDQDGESGKKPESVCAMRGFVHGHLPSAQLYDGIGPKRVKDLRHGRGPSPGLRALHVREDGTRQPQIRRSALLWA
jgi:hypothetical protein